MDINFKIPFKLDEINCSVDSSGLKIECWNIKCTIFIITPIIFEIMEVMRFGHIQYPISTRVCSLAIIFLTNSRRFRSRSSQFRFMESRRSTYNSRILPADLRTQVYLCRGRMTFRSRPLPADDHEDSECDRGALGSPNKNNCVHDDH